MSTSELGLTLMDAATQRALEGLPKERSAVALYEQAADIAARDIPDPIGGALAAVLAHAAERRRVSRRPGNAGEPRSMLALALAVIEGPR